MDRNITFTLLLLIFASFLVSVRAVKADMAPPSGSKWAPIDIIIRADEDFSDYRFFVRSYRGFDEIKISAGQPAKVSGAERMAPFAQSGQVIAVPKDMAARYDTESRDSFVDDILSDRVSGTIIVFSPSFQYAVSKNDSPKKRTETYVLHKIGQNGIEAAFLGDTSDAELTSGASDSGFSSKLISPVGAGVVIVGVIGLFIIIRLYLNYSAKK
jgi:hypothetical protein